MADKRAVLEVEPCNLIADKMGLNRTLWTAHIKQMSSHKLQQISNYLKIFILKKENS